MPLAVSDYEQVIDWMEAMIAAGARGYVTAAAVNLVMSAREDPATMGAVLGATLAVPDGQPLVWALHALGNARATRVYGPDLMARFCARAAGYGHADLPLRRPHRRGAHAAEARLRERFPGLRDRGRLLAAVPCARPPRRSGAGARDRRLGRSGRVGRHRPAQAGAVDARVCARACARRCWSASARRSTSTPDSSHRRRRWMQRSGLEWTYSLSREPRRLWRRYARHNPLFVACSRASTRRRRRTRRHGGPRR